MRKALKVADRVVRVLILAYFIVYGTGIVLLGWTPGPDALGATMVWIGVLLTDRFFPSEKPRPQITYNIHGATVELDTRVGAGDPR